MKTSDRGLAEMIGHEAIVTTRYRDSKGIWTVGVGHTAAAGPPDPVGVTEPMTLAAVIALFRSDVARYEADVRRALKVPVEQHEFDALVSFHFNTGGINESALLVALNAGDRALAAELFMNWRKPPEVVPRRLKEQHLFSTGVYSHGGKATILPANRAGRADWSSGRQIDVLAVLAGEAAPEPAAAPAGETFRDGHPRSVDVEVLQSALLRLGLYAGKVDGYYGPKTAAAVVDFRRGCAFGPDVAAADPVLVAAVLGAAGAITKT